MQTATQTALPVPPADHRLDDAAFDALLRRQLSRAYDGILNEPIPERLLRALRKAVGR